MEARGALLEAVTRLAAMSPRLDAADVDRVVAGAWDAAGHLRDAPLRAAAADFSASLLHLDGDYGALAARLLVENLHETVEADPLPGWEALHRR